jgi:hypothetical protein
MVLAGRLSPRLLVGVGALLLLALVAVLAVWQLSQTGQAPPRESAAEKYEACVRGLGLRPASNGPALELGAQANALCYDQARYGGLLRELDIRRTAFEDQAYHSFIILWLVVAITLSGVALAGAQLGMSFELALQGRKADDSESEISVERGKIVVRSSVTGLLILTISLVFFLVYAIYIFQIEELPSGAAAAQAEPQAGIPAGDAVPPSNQSDTVPAGEAIPERQAAPD